METTSGICVDEPDTRRVVLAFAMARREGRTGLTVADISARSGLAPEAALRVARLLEERMLAVIAELEPAASATVVLLGEARDLASRLARELDPRGGGGVRPS